MVVRSFCSRFIMYCRLELFCKKASLKIFSTQGQTPSVESYLEKMATLSDVLSCESCKLFQDNHPLYYLWTAASMSRSFFILISIYNLYVSSPARWNSPCRGEGAYPLRSYNQCINKWSSPERCSYVR